MVSIRERLDSDAALLCDGAMGTMLFSHGLEMGQCPEALNLDKPVLLQEIARQYAAAGADIVETNTFGGSPLKLSQYGLEDRAVEINEAAVKAARAAVGDSAYVALSVGPCSKLLKPYGDTEPEQIRDSFQTQIGAGVSAGADVVFIETMTDLAEALLALEAAKAVSTEIPVSVTMTFDVTPNGFFTIMGNTVEAASKSLADAGADLVGSNCGNGSDNMVKIAEEFARHSPLPLVIQSNAGLPEVDGDRVVYPESPDFMGGRVERLLDLGVRVVGGCCGTSPEYIAAFRRVINARSQI